MNTSILQGHTPAAGTIKILSLCAVALGLFSACGPLYVEDRWYARGYYSNGPSYAAAAPRAGVAVQGGVAPDPQFADLSPYGQWQETGEYGRVWIPYANRTPGWRPYYYGQWEYTDWGWSWVSDEVWGAGPYHYGRWTWVDSYRWVWIPDYTWGPAWVVWGHGGGCVGWAPMGPGGASWYDVHAHSTYWTYVPTAQFGGVKVQHVVVSSADVPRIHAQSVIVDNSASVRGHNGEVVTYHPGPARDQVQQWTARPVSVQPISQVPSVQPRRIPETAQAPTGGSLGSAVAPPRGSVGVAQPGTGQTPVATRPGVGTTPPVTGQQPPTRGAVGPTNPTVPNPTVPNPSVPNPGTPTRPGVGTPVTQDPPTRPGAGTPGQDPPTRPGTGYTGGPVTVPQPQPIPRPTPPPVDHGMNYAPTPSRYTPPQQTQQTYQPPQRQVPDYQAPARQGSTYTPPQQTYQAPARQAPEYQAPSRPSAPTYQAPTYQAPPRAYTPPEAPSRQGSTYSPPSYSPPPQYQRPSTPAPSYAPQRFTPPPAYSPPPSRPSSQPVPAPTRRR